jgi:hypothetical protein
MESISGRSALRPAAVLLALALTIAGCAGGATPGAATAGASQPAVESAGAGGGAGSGVDSASGSLVSSGLYDATWTWQPGNAVGVGLGGVTLNSDKGTFGNIEVLSDGSITFSTGATELSKDSPFRGTGAQVHSKNVGGADLPCSFTLDNDLTGSAGGVLHLKGTMTITGTPFEC